MFDDGLAASGESVDHGAVLPVCQMTRKRQYPHFPCCPRFLSLPAPLLPGAGVYSQPNLRLLLVVLVTTGSGSSERQYSSIPKLERGRDPLYKNLSFRVLHRIRL